MLGSIIGGRYRVLEPIGEGGMGAIFVAEHVGTRRRVALKVLSLANHGKLKEAVQRFHAEARTASALGSRHIVEIHDVGVDDTLGVPFMAMELLEGEDLDKLLKREGPLDPQAVVRIALQAASGLAEAHAHDVVHRDIKPANIFLARAEDGDITVKLLDFGIAKVKRELVGTENVDLTQSGSVLGTPMYMSPEQAVGRAVDARSDIWSLGSVMYAALSGAPPFAGVDALGRLILTLCTRPVPVLQERAGWIDPDVAAIVHRALERNTLARYPSCEPMRADLLRCLEGEERLDATMLASASPELRAVTASRLALSPDREANLLSPEVIEALLDGGEPSELSASLPLLQGGTTNKLALADGATDLDMTSPLGRATPKRTRLWWLLAAVPLAAGGIVAWQLESGPTAEADPILVPAPVPVPTSEANKPPVRVRVTVSPRDAKVEIDGRPVAMHNGAFEIEAPLGSVRRVAVSSGARRVVREIAITNTGAIPSEIAIDEAAPVRPPAAAKGEAPKGAPSKGDPERVEIDESWPK